MGLQMQEMVSAYLGLHTVIDLQLFNVIFGQNIEIQHQLALALVPSTRITNPVVVIRTWVKTDVHKSVMEIRK